MMRYDMMRWCQANAVCGTTQKRHTNLPPASLSTTSKQSWCRRKFEGQRAAIDAFFEEHGFSENLAYFDV